MKDIITSSGKHCSSIKEAIVRELLDNPNKSYEQLAECYSTTTSYIKQIVFEAKRLKILDSDKRYGRLIESTLKGLKEEQKNETTR